MLAQTPPLRLLITNTSLVHWTGSELYVRDLALEVHRRGYDVMLYSSRLGPLAETLRSAGLWVTDDLESLPAPPDLIHGQHHIETMTAMLCFPHVPAVYFCHGWLPWQETPPLHPRVLHYVGVSQRIVTHMRDEHGIAPERTHLIRNFVDLRRFLPRPPLPASPRRALVFSNHASEGNILPVLREACRAHGISLDVVGLSHGNPCTDPESLLGKYDLIFARGRAALEGVATGAAVICCDLEGLGALVTSENLAPLLQANLGVQTLTRPVTKKNVYDEIARYDAADAQRVSAHIRATASLTGTVDRVVDLYQQTLAEWSAQEPPSLQEENRAMARYLKCADAGADAAHGKRWQEFALRQAEWHTEYREIVADRDHLQRRLAQIENSLSWKLCHRLTQLAPVRYVHRRFLGGALQAQASPAPPVEPLPPAPTTDGPQLACVVMSVGNPPTLPDAVRSVRRQAPTAELVVVNTGGGDAEGTLKTAGLDVPVIHRTQRLYPGAARNLGVLATRAPFVAFLAADCMAEPGWVEGRIQRHLRGEAAVATAVTNAHPRNVWAWASHVLLFARRMPGVLPQQALRYGVSYDRRLFDRYGFFREDLRTGEDTEFNQRFVASFPLSWAPEVCAAHIHPTTLRGLLADQYARGRRMARVRRSLHPSVSRLRIAVNAWTRLPMGAWTAWRAARADERLFIAGTVPLLPLVTSAYAAGALFGRVPVEQSAPSPRLRLYALLVFHNERHHLPDYLANVAPHVDGIIALDDGSTDGSTDLVQGHEKIRELIRAPSRTPHVWNEPANRSRLIEAAWRHEADWLLVLDADERLEEEFRARAEVELAQATREGHSAASILCRECWDRPDQYRIDGIWGMKRPIRLFRPRRDHQFDDRALHGTWAPLNQGRDIAYAADLLFYHLNMITEAQRQARRNKYRNLDPNNTYQAIGYDYLTDRKGLQLERLPHGRDYRPRPE